LHSLDASYFIFVMIGDRMTMRCNAKGNLGPLTGSVKGSKQPAVAGFTLIEILIVIAIIYILASIANMAYQSYLRKAQNAAAMADVRALENEITAYKVDMNSFPIDLSQLPTGNRLDPWGHHYLYLNMADNAHWHGKCRRDRKLNPLNSDFDLYSMGEDGKSKLPLTAKDSQDDIVRANNGSFVGLGANY
jgi:general secretion pathway protein G